MKVKPLLVPGLVLAVVALAFGLIAGCGGASDEGGEQGAGDGQGLSSFDAPSALVWAVGDGGTDTPEAAEVAQLIADSDPDRLLYLGDVYGGGTLEDFEDNYDPTYGQLADVTAPTPGNHDAPTAEEGYIPYWERVLSERIPPYYSSRVSGWQILSLNSEFDHDPGSQQVRWLERQVASPGDCRIAFWHRPRFSAGLDHGDQDDIAPLWDAIEGRARIVLTGHDHDMQRLRPKGGITEFVSGAGGASLYPLDESDPRLRFSNDSQYGALRLELRPGRADYSFVTVDGEVLDRGAVSCRS